MISLSTENLLPQRPPFQFVDVLLEADEHKIITEFTIQPHTLLVTNQKLSANALIENMAQTAASGTGYLFAQKNETPPPGYIGAVKKVEIFSEPEVHETIRTIIEPLHQVGGASIVSGKIFCREKVIATAELTIFVQN